LIKEITSEAESESMKRIDSINVLITDEATSGNLIAQL